MIRFEKITEEKPTSYFLRATPDNDVHFGAAYLDKGEEICGEIFHIDNHLITERHPDEHWYKIMLLDFKTEATLREDEESFNLLKEYMFK